MPNCLDNSNSYMALSYCWNDRTYSSTGDDGSCILLEDLEALPKGYHHGRPLPRKPLSLTPNLANALRVIRQEDVYMTMWVDQICVNQADTDERSTQVALMNRIYTNANFVQIWLGDDTPDGNVAKAFDLARQLGKHVSDFHEGSASSLRLADYNVDVASCRKYGVPLLKEASNDYAALVSLVCRPWFSRSWIVQEVALNKNVVVSCGSSRIPFRPLWVAMSYCYQELGYNLGAVPRDSIAAYGSLALVLSGVRSQRPHGLLEVLLDHRGCLSTEARDKVFEFLSVAQDAHDLGIVANYNFCARFVFTQTAAKIIRHHPNLDILSYAAPWPPRDTLEDNGIVHGKCKDATKQCHDESHPPVLPSWAPDWSTAVDYRALRPIGPKKRRFSFSAAKNSKHKPQFCKHDTQLGLQGYTFDQVVEVGRMFERSLPKQWLSLMDAEAISEVRSAKIYKPTGESMWDAFFKTITGGDEVLAATCGRPSYEVTEDDVARHLTSFPKEQFHEQYQTLLTLLRLALFRQKLESRLGAGTVLCKLIDNVASRVLSLQTEIQDYDVAQSFAKAILGGSTNRRFMRSRNGYIGFAGPQTRPGDHIALFAGGGVPIVIRPKNQLLGSETRWEIVGDAYVHGVMFGEAFDEARCETMWIV
nr:hypothetical protein [Paramyrothecium sp.]